jgi:hypothetical protein
LAQVIDHLTGEERLPEALSRMVAAGQMSFAARRAGYDDGGLERAEAERLAALGISKDQATEGFGNLATQRELWGPLPGMENSEDTIGRDTQLDAEFGGNAYARERRRRQARQRTAAFQRSGGLYASNEGVTALAE